jgi:glycyl-tRNA synthetase alpha subunit
MVLHPDMKYKVHIVRLVIVNASHFQKHFSLTAVSQVLQAFASMHCMDVRNVVSVPVHATYIMNVNHYHER